MGAVAGRAVQARDVQGGIHFHGQNPPTHSSPVPGQLPGDVHGFVNRIGELEVAGGDGSRVEVLAAEHFVYALAPEENPQVALSGPGFVYAPVAEGADAGFAYVLIQGKAVGKFPVVYGRTVELEREVPESIWEKLFGRKAHEGTTAENTVRQGGGLPAEQ